jgi:hypothetical protein
MLRGWSHSVRLAGAPALTAQEDTFWMATGFAPLSAQLSDATLFIITAT